MPAAAGIAAAGTIGGAAIGGKSAAKVARIQAKTAQQEMAQTQGFYDDAVKRYQPNITAGDAATNTYSALLGTGGDPTAANAAYSTWKNAAGYQNAMTAALDGVNASAYSSGLGRSGAAFKALQDRAADLANNTLGSYMGDLNTQAQNGLTAKNSLSGQATTALGANNAATSNAANASSNAALASGNGWSNAFQSLGNLAANAYQSSYGGNTGAPVYNGSNWNSWVQGN